MAHRNGKAQRAFLAMVAAVREGKPVRPPRKARTTKTVAPTPASV